MKTTLTIADQTASETQAFERKVEAANALKVKTRLRAGRRNNVRALVTY